MKKIKHFKLYSLFIIILGIFVFSSCFLFPANQNINNKEVFINNNLRTNNNNDKPIIFENMDIQCKLDKYGCVNIKYDFNVLLNDFNLHEVYIVVPYKETIYKKVNGNTVRKNYYAKIDNLKLHIADNEKLVTYTDDVKNDYLTIAIRNESGYDFQSKKHFSFSYDYFMTFEDKKVPKEFYFNILSENVLDINCLTFSVEFPKDIDFSNFNTFIYTGQNNSNNLFDDYIVDGNKIVSKNAFNLEANNALTVLQNLPENYFLEKDGHNWILWLFCIISAITIFAIVFMKFYNKDSKFIVPVQVQMPKILPAECEMYLNLKITNKSFGATIIYLANKGYLKVITEGDNNEPKYLVKVKDLPEDFNSNLKTVFNNIFANGDKVSFDDLNDVTKTENIEKIKAYSDFLKIKINEKYYEKKSKLISNFTFILWAICIASLVGCTYLFNKLNLGAPVIPLVIVTLVLGIFMIVSSFIRINNNSIVNKFAILMLCLPFLFWIIFFIDYTIISDFYFILVDFIIFGIIDFIPYFKKMTAETKGIYCDILGVKNLIEKTQKEQIKMFVNENPKLFYDVLPYAYVLGISDKWISSFEGIDLGRVDWIEGDSGLCIYGMTPIFYNISNKFVSLDSKIAKNLMQRSSDFSGSSFGGGHSSGGGFSGGGGGGGSFGAR